MTSFSLRLEDMQKSTLVDLAEFVVLKWVRNDS
jgi:hypothetical protein